MKVTYVRSYDEWSRYSEFIQELVQKYGVRKICDVGGGANPILPLNYIEENQLDYSILDISIEELSKTPDGYRKICMDIVADNFELEKAFDMVITKMMAEHVKSGISFHKNIYKMLNPGGISIHYFPTLYAIPFLVNKIVPENISSRILDLFSPRDKYQRGKFPAYYDWCFGPIPTMISMLSQIGFEIIEYRGIFGNKYYRRIPVARELHSAFVHFLIKNPNPFLTSYAQVILRKPFGKK